jgi:hypothetical protein
MTDHDERLRRATEALARKAKGPDASFTEAVMARVRQEEPPRRSAVTWVLAPSRVRVPRYWLPLAAAALLMVWFAGTRFGASHAAPRGAVATTAQNAPHGDTVYVRFELVAPRASQVRLAGDFSGWQPQVSLAKSTGGVWVATVPVPVGVHRYQFVVDDAWMPDPAAGAVDDGFGGRNSVVVVGPRGVVRS